MSENSETEISDVNNELCDVCVREYAERLKSSDLKLLSELEVVVEWVVAACSEVGVDVLQVEMKFPFGIG